MRQFYYDKELENYFNKSSLKIPKNHNLLNTFLDNISEQLNIKIGNMIGCGFEGQVYEIKNRDKVIKFQPRRNDDYSDIETIAYLNKKKLKNIAKIFSFGIIEINDNILNNICINGDFNEIYYVISEKAIVNKKLKNLFIKLDFEYHLLYKPNIVWVDSDGDNFLSFIEDFYDKNSGELDNFLKTTKFKKEVKQVISSLNELKNHDIYYNDFVVKNFGFDKDGNLLLFDINGYEGDEEFDLYNKKRLNV